MKKNKWDRKFSLYINQKMFDYLNSLKEKEGLSINELIRESIIQRLKKDKVDWK